MSDSPCPTCSGPSRETVGMVCQTCGTDYALESPNRHRRACAWCDLPAVTTTEEGWWACPKHAEFSAKVWASARQAVASLLALHIKGAP